MHYLTHKELLLPNIKYGFFGKNIPYSTLQYLYGNDARKNREVICKELGIKGDISILKQVHGSDTIIVDKTQTIGEEIAADAQVTNKKNIALGILTADCVPILLFDKENEILGAIHAGWRGARGNIINNTIQRMQQIGAEDIAAIIGPCIHQSSYEVDHIFYNNFIEEANGNEEFFQAATRANHFMFDLPSYVISKLKANKINNIYNINKDTLKEEKNFFSHRRSTLQGKVRNGSNLSVIVLS